MKAMKSRDGLRGLTRAAVCVAAAMSLVGGSATMANASALPDATPVVSISAEQETSMRAWMDGVDVSQADQDTLIENLRNGILPLSSTDAEPVSTLHETVPGEERTISVYADGSRSLLVEQVPVVTPPGVITPFATLTGCAQSGTWRVNCTVKIADAVSSAWFVIDYYPSSSGAAQVRDMRSKSCANSVGSCNVSGSILRSVQSGTAPAWAELSYTAWVGPIQAVTGAFGIRVSGTNASVYG